MKKLTFRLQLQRFRLIHLAVLIIILQRRKRRKVVQKRAMLRFLSRPKQSRSMTHIPSRVPLIMLLLLLLLNRQFLGKRVRLVNKLPYPAMLAIAPMPLHNPNEHPFRLQRFLRLLNNHTTLFGIGQAKYHGWMTCLRRRSERACDFLAGQRINGAPVFDGFGRELRRGRKVGFPSEADALSSQGGQWLGYGFQTETAAAAATDVFFSTLAATSGAVATSLAIWTVIILLLRIVESARRIPM